ncbi:Bacterial sugar transferase, putative [Synechococcus sp. PCC 7335]|uniref:sugar transferase n=1 Tax=Synechococcus sp. (strain ATCC 29403 / PCC 7335) TaxID=91464 RepID=UPI00017EC783|nr:sugar transferase [Synechococcus sp. PCC 7335]EDX84884.1 Bacterial sugar transferase, putative [Synechococcus sp. PCC 7335]
MTRSILRSKQKQGYAPSAPHASTRSTFKRALDITGALVGLVILGVLLIPIAIAIRLDSEGPIFYAQERFGLQGKPFTIIKFRSMVNNAEALKATVENEANGLLFKNTEDPRITRVGRILRQTSLDEFPQFWNVLRGDMSLVGTRPPTADEVEHYTAHHWQRLAVRPGLTGQWQVNGRSEIKDFEEVVALDLAYQQLWTPFYDVKLLVRTVVMLLSRRSGAY